jgi:hypothetical protein
MGVQVKLLDPFKENNFGKPGLPCASFAEFDPFFPDIFGIDRFDEGSGWVNLNTRRSQYFIRLMGTKGHQKWL